MGIAPNADAPNAGAALVAEVAVDAPKGEGTTAGLPKAGELAPRELGLPKADGTLLPKAAGVPKEGLAGNAVELNAGAALFANELGAPNEDVALLLKALGDPKAETLCCAFPKAEKAAALFCGVLDTALEPLVAGVEKAPVVAGTVELPKEEEPKAGAA